MADEQVKVETGLTSTKANYGTTRVLKMIFVCNGGKKMTWNLKYPKTNLTKVEVENGVMQYCITNDLILYGNNEASDISDAYIYETRTLEIAS